VSPELANELAEAFREHRDAFGVSIKIGSETITAVVEESALSRELSGGGGGFTPEVEFQVKALLSDLKALPALGTDVVFNDLNLKVSKVGIHPGGLIGEYSIRPRGR
jgi:hypothetical protein